jgi:hypothetical protein
MYQPTPIQIESHPPERRRTETLMCGCCCCCCCCLHTVGGIIGSAIAPAFGKGNRMPITYYYDDEWDISLPNIARTGVSAVKVFWFTTLIVTVLWVFGSVALGAADHGPSGESLLVGLVILALLYPAVQLGCAILTLLWMAFSNRDDKPYQLKQVGKITLGLFLGTLAGILSMVGIGIVFSAF